MKIFWTYYILTTLVLGVIFLILIFTGISNDNVLCLSVSKYIMFFNVLLFLIAIIYTISKIKYQTYKTLIIMVVTFLVLCSEVFLYYGVLFGLLG